MKVFIDTNILIDFIARRDGFFQFEAAYAAGCDVIITRNKRHFPLDALQVLEPGEFFGYYWP